MGIMGDGNACAKLNKSPLQDSVTWRGKVLILTRHLKRFVFVLFLLIFSASLLRSDAWLVGWKRLLFYVLCDIPHSTDKPNSQLWMEAQLQSHDTQGPAKKKKFTSLYLQTFVTFVPKHITKNLVTFRTYTVVLTYTLILSNKSDSCRHKLVPTET